MIVPVQQNLPGVIGAPWDVTFQLWQDETHTTPYPTDSAEFRFEVAGLTKSEGGGVTKSGGSVTIHLSSSETRNMDEQEHFRLVAVIDGEPNYPVHGEIEFDQP